MRWRSQRCVVLIWVWADDWALSVQCLASWFTLIHNNTDIHIVLFSAKHEIFAAYSHSFHHLNSCVPGRRFVRNAISLSSSADSAPLSRCLIFWQLLDTFCEPQQTDNFKQTDNQVQMLFIEILSLVSYRRIQHFSASRSVKKPKTWIKCGISMCVSQGDRSSRPATLQTPFNLIISRCWLMSHCVFPPSLHFFVMEVEALPPANW